MGEGNFQTRATYGCWIGACYAKVIELKLPNLNPDTTVMSNDMSTVVSISIRSFPSILPNAYTRQILNNLPNCRYQDYLRARDPVGDFYQLKNPTTPDEREATKTALSKIYPNYFHYRCYHVSYLTLIETH